MGKTTKINHTKAIEYADKVVPNAQLLLDRNEDAPAIFRRWIAAFKLELERLDKVDKEAP